MKAGKMNTQHPPKMPTHTFGIRVLAGTLVLLPLVACTGKMDDKDAAVAPTEPQAMPVEVLTAQRQTLPLSLETVGQAEGSREVQIRARVSGLLERKLFNEGEPVKTGTALFTIERAPYEIAVQQAKSTVTQRQVQLDQAHREVLRIKPLAEDEAVPQREYDDALSNERLAIAALDGAKTSLREAELNLSYTSVTAPISGVTGRAPLSQGNLLSAGADNVLTTITQTDPIWVRFSLSDAEAKQLHATRKAEVQLLSSDSKVQLSGGRLNFSGSTIDTRMGTVQVRAEFPNPDLAIMPGQFTRVQVLAGEASAYKVPQSAVTQTEQGKMVWVARNGKAVAVPVETGAWIGSDWAINKGLNDGDQIIIDNLIKLSPDAPVAPIMAAAPAASAAR